MGKKHLKRLSAPKTWDIKRKGIKFVTKSSPGPHSLEAGIPFCVLLRDILKYADTLREIKKILNTNEIRIDGKIRKDFRYPIGLFDSIEFKNINECFRVVLSGKGKIELVKIGKEEASLKPCKITGKTIVRGKLQLNLYDGKNILVDSGSYKVGDTLLLALPGQKINRHLKLDKKSPIFLTGGKHIGEIGIVEDIIENRIIYKDKAGNLIETSKKYAFVVGDTKPLITLE